MPGTCRAPPGKSERVNAALRAGLVARGLDPLVTLGSDPNSHHSEASWAVTGLDDSAACALGATYGQIGVFRITRDRQTVLGGVAEWRIERGL